MTFDLVLVALLAVFSIYLHLIWTADEFYYNNTSDLFTFPDWSSDYDGFLDIDSYFNYNGDVSVDGLSESNIQPNLTSGSFSTSKRKRSGISEQKIPAKRRSLYQNKTRPINPKIDQNMVNILAAKERQLIAFGTHYVWNNIIDLEPKVVKAMCIEEWKIQAQEIPEIEMEDGMEPDCFPSALLGPSKDVKNYRFCIGNFHYAAELIDKEFFPDLIRCNCAYLMKGKGKESYRTVKYSKRFFYLLKHVDTSQLFILTAHGALTSRKVKFVKVHELKINNSDSEHV